MDILWYLFSNSCIKIIEGGRGRRGRRGGGGGWEVGEEKEGEGGRESLTIPLLRGNFIALSVPFSQDP